MPGRNLILLLNLSAILLLTYESVGQTAVQAVKGIVVDSESKAPLGGAEIIAGSGNELTGTLSGPDGRFRLVTAVGRITVTVRYMGYNDLIIRDILVSTGREIDIVAELSEKVTTTGEVLVTAGKRNFSSDNHMASVSARSIRVDDALRFAGGYYDPSRMITAFSGVSTANSDQSNELVIRGNSSRGLLWRLEGVEIPNPNHFSTGQGGSGGAYSAITSNALSGFDFYTGAFPSEFGNAVSGVMDLELRNGNSDKSEFAFQTGMIGAEVSAEGPFSGNSAASFLFDARYVDFGLLMALGFFDLGNSNITPKTFDAVTNIHIPARRAGNFSFFAMYAVSNVGKTALKDPDEWTLSSDGWEENETEEIMAAGVKHSVSMPNRKTYLRTTVAFTSHRDAYYEGLLDTVSLSLRKSYEYSYNYPSLKLAGMINHKFNASSSLRAGINHSILAGNMLWYRSGDTPIPDTIVDASAITRLTQVYGQYRLMMNNSFTINTGFHLMHFAQNSQTVLEPRMGLKYNLTDRIRFSAGLGLHSRTESLAVYNTGIRQADNTRVTLNSRIGMTRSAQLAMGFELDLSEDVLMRLEWYHQYLYQVPVINRPSSTYSLLNIAQGLPDSELENTGEGKNKGVEITVEKSFTRHYYVLATASFFDSRYKPGDNRWHPTYYNNKSVINILAGKDFSVGNEGRNLLGINLRCHYRGGYRYTPVDYARSILQKRVVYLAARTYDESLPGFFRLDGGISFRMNNPGNSWIVMLDIQNITDRENIFRKRFFYDSGKVETYNIYSIGIVPVFNFRIEF